MPPAWRLTLLYNELVVYSVDGLFDAAKDLFYRAHAVDVGLLAFFDIEVFER